MFITKPEWILDFLNSKKSLFLGVFTAHLTLAITIDNFGKTYKTYLTELTNA
ncbi:hypothetical protein [Zobellia nedashkovskayae]|uniref:hypothetical protein n=1 Tax=Zobellia nedashkovskayae TaxID=2779510 RepID=UPI001D0365D4|nr:hypothetical protein [Zobellia nedashkovskayae]